jgi:uncharacterized membrane protein YcaP (DUF421 family)
MDYLQVAIAEAGSFIALFLFTKLTGNRQMSQLSLFDYISGITIGSIAAEMATMLESDFWKPFIALAVYTLMTVLLFFLTARSHALQRLITGKSLILYFEGQLYYDNFKKAKLELSEFMTQCRNNGYFDLSKLKAAVLEANGKISFLPKSQYRPAEPGDFGLYPSSEKLLTNVIMDGKILFGNLEYTGNDEKWLMQKLAEKNITDISEVMLATCDDNSNLTLYEKIETKMSRDIFT